MQRTFISLNIWNAKWQKVTLNYGKSSMNKEVKRHVLGICDWNWKWTLATNCDTDFCAIVKMSNINQFSFQTRNRSSIITYVPILICYGILLCHFVYRAIVSVKTCTKSGHTGVSLTWKKLSMVKCLFVSSDNTLKVFCINKWFIARFLEMIKRGERCLNS